MRELFLGQIEEVRQEVIDILADVSTVTRQAVRSLVEGDLDAALEIIEGDDEFDRRCLAVEERVISIIATQNPVAVDLRELQSFIIIAFHEERMADLAANVAKATKRTYSIRGPQTLYDLIQAQGNLVYRVVEATHEALVNNDLEMAMRLPELDEPIDHLYKQFFRELARIMSEDDLEWASKMVLATRYLERIGDNAVNIGERLAYMITGERDALDASSISDGAVVGDGGAGA